jgi:hypothetical protein
MISQIALALLLSLLAPPENRLERAIIQVESAGRDDLIGTSGERGAWQVMPLYGCCRLGLTARQHPRKRQLQFCRQHYRTLAPLWAWRPLNRLSGRAVLARWLHRARGNVELAIRSYNCGEGGLTRRCGDQYLARIRQAGGRW